MLERKIGLSPIQKSSFKSMGLSVFAETNWDSYIALVLKTASKKMGALICSMAYPSTENILYLIKSTIDPCMEYWCHV